MKFIFATLALVATALATSNGGGKTCKNGESVVCKGQGNAGLLSLGNVAPGALGDNCSGGDVYCCSTDDVNVRHWRNHTVFFVPEAND